MSNIATILASDTTVAASGLTAKDKRLRWCELCLVLLVAFGSYIVHGVHLLIVGPTVIPPRSTVQSIAGIVQESGAVLLLGYVLSRRGLRFANLGLKGSVRDLAIGMLLAALSYAAYAEGHVLIQGLHKLLFGSLATVPAVRPLVANHSLMTLLFAFVNPFFEELIVRAYLMTEVLELTASPMLAVLLSVAVQFSYHLYYGWVVAMAMCFLFLVSALYYVRCRRALPIIAAHAFFDVYPALVLFLT